MPVLLQMTAAASRVHGGAFALDGLPQWRALRLLAQHASKANCEHRPDLKYMATLLYAMQ